MGGRVKLVIFILTMLIYFIPIVTLKITIISVISYLWFIFTIIYIVNVYKNRDREYDNKFKGLYCKVIPNNRSPESLGFLLDGSVKEDHLLASLKDLMRKKIILIGRFKDNNEYVLVSKKAMLHFLSKSEAYLMRWFFENIGNGEYVTFKQLKREGTNNSGYFNSCYKEYIELVNLECARYSFFESKKALLDNMLFYFVISYIFVMYNAFVSHNFMIAGLMFVVTSLFVVYVNSFFKRTLESSREYDEWKAFKRWIKEIPNSISDYDIDSLELTIVYAKLLKVDKYVKNIVVNRKDTKKNNFISCYKFGILDELDKILNTEIRSSAIAMVLLGKNRGISSSRKLRNDKIIEIIYERED